MSNEVNITECGLQLLLFLYEGQTGVVLEAQILDIVYLYSV